jgi:hypothetical protein
LAPGHPALTGTAEPNLHVHGVGAEDVAAILADVNRGCG